MTKYDPLKKDVDQVEYTQNIFRALTLINIYVLINGL